jgi:hypothetical protein
MNDDVEQRLDRLTPRGVRPELRDVVLGAVAAELQSNNSATTNPTFGVPLLRRSSGRPEELPSTACKQAVAHSEFQGGGRIIADTTIPDSPWFRRAAMAVAASLLLGIGLNVWVSKTSTRRLAQFFGPPPISKQALEIAKDVEKITDAETGRWIYSRLTITCQPGDNKAIYAKYRDTIKRLIDELQTVSKDSYHDSEMDRDRTGWIGGDRFDCQRRVRRDYRFTA